MGQDQSRLIQRLNNVCHSKSFTRAGDTKQRLKLISLFKSLYQFLNSLWLIAGWFILGM